MTFLLAPENVAFTVSLALMLTIATLEGVTTLLGAGLSQLVDSLMPATLLGADIGVDVDIDADIDADMDADLDGDAVEMPNALSRLLGWLSVGKVPVLVLLIVFLTVFGLAGLAVQAIAQSVAGLYLPAWIAPVPALALALPLVRTAGHGIARIMPREETSAVSGDSFVGRIATLTIGKASGGKPAEAKLHDEHGQTHYVMVEPDRPGEVFEAGERILIVKRAGARYLAIRNTSEALAGEQAHPFTA